MKRNWANLEALPLSLVLDKLEEQIDHIRFGVVCKNWHSVAKLSHQNQHFLTNIMPMLMIPTKIGSMDKSSLFGIASKKVYPVKLPVPSNYGTCFTSTHGWLVMFEEKYKRITLLNPFKSVAPITLPPFNFLERYIHFHQFKVTLSLDPITSPNDYVVVVSNHCLEHCQLHFIGAGQNIWSNVRHDEYYNIRDVVFYKGLVYALCSLRNDIISFDTTFSSDNGEIIPNIVFRANEGSFDEPDCHDAYLVKSLEGDLWMVQSIVNWETYQDDPKQSFHVYKLDFDENGKVQGMLRLKSLGDNVVFIGESDPICVSSSYFTCLQRDSIYYTRDFVDENEIPNLYGAIGIGIYNVKDGSHHQYLDNPIFDLLQPCFWILPPFQWD